MSIDFTGITGVSDDYGVVTQIADASGRVLWKKKPSVATLTITPNYDWGKFIIDGTTYGGTATVTLEVPIGTVVTCKMMTEDSYNSSSLPYVTVNGTTVFKGSSGVDYPIYNYTVVGNATLVGNRGSGSGNRYGYITITEIPEGHALVTVYGTGDSSVCHVTINGVKYSGYYASASPVILTVPIGTVAYCYVDTDNDTEDAEVYLNGKVVHYSGNYEYTITGQTTIKLEADGAYNGDWGVIYITET